MNKNYDFASKKTQLILLFICLMFFLIVIRAFDYLPDEQSDINNEQKMEQINKPIESNSQTSASYQAEQPNSLEEDNTVEPQQEQIEQENSINNSDSQKQEDVNEPKDKQVITEGLVPIDDKDIGGNINGQNIEAQVAPSEPKETIEEKMEKAQNLKEQGNYNAALEAYSKIALSAPSNEISAKCYEEMSKVYSTQKRYGSAIVYAQKANSISPSPSREALIRRLYEKTGMNK